MHIRIIYPATVVEKPGRIPWAANGAAPLLRGANFSGPERSRDCRGIEGFLILPRFGGGGNQNSAVPARSPRVSIADNRHAGGRSFRGRTWCADAGVVVASADSEDSLLAICTEFPITLPSGPAFSGHSVGFEIARL